MINEKWGKIKLSFFVNSFLLFFIVLIIILAYVFMSDSTFGFGTKTGILDDFKDKSGTLLSAEIGISTLTFAFIAFISISPTSSGSSISINRLAWRGYWMFRYPSLLILTSTLIVVNSIFTISENTEYLIMIGIVLSTIILLVAVSKYWFYNSNLNKNAANNLVHSLFFSFFSKKRNINKFKKYSRIFVNPLKGSKNLDLFREIFSNKLIMDSLLYVIIFQENKNVQIEQIEDIVDKMTLDKNLIFFLRKLTLMIERNNSIMSNDKVELVAWLTIKMERLYDVSGIHEKIVDYFFRVFGLRGSTVTAKQSHINQQVFLKIYADRKMEDDYLIKSY